MCGIAGYLHRDRLPLDAAIAALRHRGPDDQGLFEAIFSGQLLGLGHARLSILDLSPAGRQPLASPDGRQQLSFNGEIYNYRELRTELASLGHPFHTETDSEVILAGYRQWGDAVVTRLRGMFAFALVDLARDRILLARDRLGIKPLYYHAPPGSLRFASELKGVLALLPEPPPMDPWALRDYLTYLYVPYPRSFYQGIHQLPPAHTLVWERGQVALSRYWTLPAPERPRPRQDLVRELRALLEETVRLHLASDVPLGAFLSGGLDSTTLVALMARESSHPIKTFCMTFEPNAGLYDEREYAREVATRYGTDHTEIPVRPDLTELLPLAAQHFDEPFGNPTALLVYLLSQKTREHVTVALAGDGGDEIFLGYPRYQGAALSQGYRFVPRSLRQLVAREVVPRLPESTRGRHGLRRAREFLTESLRSPDEMYARWVTYFTEEEQQRLLTPEVLRETQGYRPFNHLAQALPPGKRGFVDRCQGLDLGTFLPGNLLTYSDRMSMAHGLEVRVPFCDHKLVEFMARIPASQKMPRLRTKSLLREAVADLLPATVRRRRKLGFNPPVGMWLKDGAGAGLEVPKDLIRPEALAELWSEHRTGRRDRGLSLWALISLGMQRPGSGDDTTQGPPRGGVGVAIPPTRAAATPSRRRGG